MNHPILEFFTVFTIAILPQILTSFYPQGMRELLGSLPGNWRFLTALPSRLGMILLILYIGANRLDGFYSIGLDFHEAASSMTLIVAVLLMGYLQLIFVLSDRRSMKAKEEIEATRQRTLAGLRYSTSAGIWQKLLYFVDIWLAVIGEELVYRGYLILLLGRGSGYLFLWIAFSLFLSIVVHLYQGRTGRLILSHALLASLFIFVAVITNSLFAAIVPHLVYNTVWLVRALTNKPKEALLQSDPST